MPGQGSTPVRSYKPPLDARGRLLGAQVMSCESKRQHRNEGEACRLIIEVPREDTEWRALSGTHPLLVINI